MRWPWSGEVRIEAFDAVVDLSPRLTGDDAGPALAAVRRALAAMPGVERVSVGRHDGRGAVSDVWARVMPPGGGIMPKGPEWEALRLRVKAAAEAALISVPRPEPSYNVAHMQPVAGFADGAAFRSVPIRMNTGRSLSAPAPSPTEAARNQVEAGEAAALDDAALTAALLSLVVPVDPVPVAARAVAQFGSFAAVLAATPRELDAVPGLGAHSIAVIKLVHAAALRAQQAGLMRRVVLHDMERLTDYLSAVLARERTEQFRILFLDGLHCLIADEAQARGTVNHTPVYPREVVRRALELRAAALVLVHNHPSGDPTPSREDVEMTAMVRDAAALLGVEVQDHIVVGNGSWVSFREAGLLS